MYIGVDVGGTNMSAGLVDKNGDIIDMIKIKSNVDRPSEAIVRDIIDMSKELAARAGKKGVGYVGIGIPGTVDRERGRVIYTCNAPFRDTELERLFRAEWDIPVYLENDANCAALGEVYAGAAKDCCSAVIVTIGTGIGGGVIIDRNIYKGFNGGGTEIGHMVIKSDGRRCTCGRRGCWEAYASASALKRMTRLEMLRSPGSLMWELADSSLEGVSGKTAFQAAKLGDPAGTGVVKRYIKYLAMGITNIVNVFQPEIICLGGGVSNEDDEYLLNPIIEIVERERYTKQLPQTVIKKAFLGSEAGVIGAAMLGRQVLECVI